MPIIRAARDTFRDIRNATIESPAMPLTSTSLLDMLGGGAKSTSGVTVTETSALGMTAVWRAVNLIAGTAASLPLHAYRQVDDVRLPAGDTSQGAKLLDKPHPDLTPFEFWELVYAHLLLWGNAYLRVLRDRMGRIQELWPIHPARVRAGRETETGTKVYLIDNDVDREMTDQQILHIPGFGYDGVCGVSPIRLARQGVGLALAAEHYGAQLFGNGSLASGILQTEQRLKEGDADRLKRRWRDKATGLDNAHDVVVLDTGAKFQQLSIPPEDAQFIESRRFQIAEIARLFGIPPHMLMETDKSTSWGTGIEQQGIGFVTYTLRPWLTRVEQRLTQLINEESVYARYTVEGLLRGDSAAQVAYYRGMWDIGALSTNDIRRLSEQTPVDGGDVRYRPLNMGELGQADPGSDAPAEDDAATVAETVQKVYLGVGPVLTTDEAREIVNAAGANLPIPKPADPQFEAAPATQEVPADA